MFFSHFVPCSYRCHFLLLLIHSNHTTNTLLAMDQKIETREPKDIAVFQQRMRAWTPILDPKWVIFVLFVIGAVCVPIGVQFNIMSDNVVEYYRTYDSYSITNEWTEECGIDSANANKTCIIRIDVETDMKGPVMVYYEIDNFYQNHREYATSRDDAQVRYIDYICCLLIINIRHI
jgi:hypothetical protein